MINYEIIASGSSGNCVIIGDVMVDCGVSYKIIKDYLYDIKTLLLTHTHGDHINGSTLGKIKKEFPRITILGNYEVHQEHGVDLITNEGFDTGVGQTVFTPFLGDHDVLCHGYVWEHESQRIIYATDLSNLDNAPPGPYDYLFLESNHDETKLALVRKQIRKYGYNVYRSSLRHLSTQKSKAFYYTNRRHKDSEWIELHKSSRFY